MNDHEKELLSIAYKTLEEKKGIRTEIIDIRELTIIADYFIITSGSSLNQVRALSDHVAEALGKAGCEPRQIEGYQTANWILMDYSDIVIHIFTEHDRSFYNLEHIWRDGKFLSASEKELLL